MSSLLVLFFNLYVSVLSLVFLVLVYDVGGTCSVSELNSGAWYVICSILNCWTSFCSVFNIFDIS